MLPSIAIDEPDGGLSESIRSLRQFGQLRTLRLAHEPAVARAPLARQLDLLRAVSACASLRIAQLVNIGLGDAWGYALADVLPRMDSLRVLDVSHNYIGSGATRAIAAALPANHSLLWLQLLPQWLQIDRDVETALSAALSDRRIKLDVAVRGARSVLSSRGDVGEPSVAFEWRGAVLSTGSAQPTAHTSNPKWDEHFTICVPASLLWPPSRTPLTLSLIDLRRSAQLAAEPPMGSCELPLGALLLAASSTLGVRCPVRRHPSAAPVASRGNGAELHADLTILGVGMAHPDDHLPGVPAAWRQALADQRKARFGAARKLQSAWRARGARGSVGAKLRHRNDMSAVIRLAVSTEADEAEVGRGGVCALLGRGCGGLVAAVGLALRGEAAPDDDDDRGWRGATAGLLPTGFKLSDDDHLSYDEGERAGWRRRKRLLQLMLFLLCMSISVLLAASAVLLLMHESQQAAAQPVGEVMAGLSGAADLVEGAVAPSAASLGQI